MDKEEEDNTREKVEWDKNLIWALPMGVVILGSVVWAIVEQVYTHRHQLLEDTMLGFMVLGAIGFGIWGLFKLWNMIKPKR